MLFNLSYLRKNETKIRYRRGRKSGRGKGEGKTHIEANADKI